MKITLIEFECNADELKQSRTLSDSMTYALSRLCERIAPVSDETEEDEGAEQDG